MARANDPRPPADQPSRAQALQLAAAERVVRKEAAVLRKLAGREDEAAELLAFFEGHVAYVRDAMLTTDDIAAQWCAEQRRFLTENGWPALDHWQSRAQALANLVNKGNP